MSLPPCPSHVTTCQRAVTVLLLLLGLAASWANEPSALLVEGIQPYQVFPRQGRTAAIAFRAAGPGTLTVEIFKSGEAAPFQRAEWTLTSTNLTDLTLTHVPVGGEYTFRFKLGDRTAEFRHLLVGELWVIAGQSNAVGCSHRPETPSPGVHYLRDNRWGAGADPLFPPIFPMTPGETYVAAWRRAGQRYFEQTGIPVGMMGWAFGGVPMSRFWDAEGKELVDLKPLVTRHGRGATTFLWYQGEADANLQGLPVYLERLTALAAAMRRYTENPNLLLGVVQVSYRSDTPEKAIPHFGRMGELQRQFCTRDPRALLFPSSPYTHFDIVHLDFDGYMALGDRIGVTLAEVERTGRVSWLGPRPVDAALADASRQVIRVRFENARELKLLETPLGAGTWGQGHQPVMDWRVTDEEHQGYAEITSAKIEQGRVLLEVAGASLDTTAVEAQATGLRAPLVKTGFLPLRKVSVDGLNVLLELAEPAGPGARVSYGLMSDALSTLTDEQGQPCAVFTDLPVKGME